MDALTEIQDKKRHCLVCLDTSMGGIKQRKAYKMGIISKSNRWLGRGGNCGKRGIWKRFSLASSPEYWVSSCDVPVFKKSNIHWIWCRDKSLELLKTLIKISSRVGNRLLDPPLREKLIPQTWGSSPQRPQNTKLQEAELNRHLHSPQNSDPARCLFLKITQPVPPW